MLGMFWNWTYSNGHCHNCSVFPTPPPPTQGRRGRSVQLQGRLLQDPDLIHSQPILPGPPESTQRFSALFLYVRNRPKAFFKQGLIQFPQKDGFVFFSFLS